MSTKYRLFGGGRQCGRTAGLRSRFPHEFFWRNDPFIHTRPCWLLRGWVQSAILVEETLSPVFIDETRQFTKEDWQRLIDRLPCKPG
jgi:hypothetical protein